MRNEHVIECLYEIGTFQAQVVVTMTEHRSILPSLSIQKLDFGVLNAVSGPTGQWDCVETLTNRQSWVGKRQTSKYIHDNYARIVIHEKYKNLLRVLSIVQFHFL